MWGASFSGRSVEYEGMGGSDGDHHKNNFGKGHSFSARRGCVGEGEVPTGGSKKAFPGRVYWLSGLE